MKRYETYYNGMPANKYKQEKYGDILKHSETPIDDILAVCNAYNDILENNVLIHKTTDPDVIQDKIQKVINWIEK